MQAVGLLPREKHLGCRTGLHGQGRADGNRVAQTHGAVRGGDADALVALTAEELRTLVRVVTQSPENRAGGGEEAILTRRGSEFDEARAEHEATLHVACDEAVVFESHGQAVSGGAGQAGGRHELSQGGRTGFERRKHDRSLVENADSTRVVHVLILQSHDARRKFKGLKKA